jgi:YHS domain-containing protein
MLRGLFRLVFYIFIAYIAYFIIRLLFPPQRRAGSARPTQQLSGTMVKDEFCNTYIPLEDAIRDRINGQDYFFCSQECRKKFLEQKKPAGNRTA